jgi:ankyrin repeat protein
MRALLFTVALLSTTLSRAAVGGLGLSLSASVAVGDAARVKAALAAGAEGELNVRGPAGQTPLMAACLGGHADVAVLLLDAGADATIGEKDGYTCLHGAGFQGRAAVARAALPRLDHSASQHRDGFFPIHRACWGREERHADTVAAFLEAGVPADLKAANGETCATMTKNAHTLAVLAAARGDAREL